MAPSIELPVFIAALQRGSRALARQAHLLKTDGLMNLYIFWRDPCKGGPAGVGWMAVQKMKNISFVLCSGLPLITAPANGWPTHLVGGRKADSPDCGRVQYWGAGLAQPVCFRSISIFTAIHTHAARKNTTAPILA